MDIESIFCRYRLSLKILSIISKYLFSLNRFPFPLVYQFDFPVLYQIRLKTSSLKQFITLEEIVAHLNMREKWALLQDDAMPKVITSSSSRYRYTRNYHLFEQKHQITHSMR